MADWVAKFLGSWWAVALHSSWFLCWLVFDFDLEILTLGVSLEAIFIGTFLLMSANRQEAQRDKIEEKERQGDREKIERDIELDIKAERQLREIKAIQKEIHEEVGQVKKEIKKLQE